MTSSLPGGDPLTLHALAEVCAVAGYCGDAWRGVLGAGSDDAGHVDVPVHSWRELGDEPLAVLVRLFALGGHVSATELSRAFPRVVASAVAEAGLLHVDAGRWSAPYALTPVGDRLILSDWARSKTPPPDVVTGVNAASRTTANLVIRRPAARVLDLGTGCGVQAVLAAGHARELVGTDINERALAFARLNAELNAIDTVHWRHGSWFDPVDQQSFDCIIANPPFVISPDHDFIFRDGGDEGDALSRFVVRGAASRLERGGFAHVLCNWVVPPGSDWSEPVFEWIDGTGCDAVVIRYASEDAVTYAAFWNHRLRYEGGDSFKHAMGRWLAEYRRLGIERIDSGMVVLRRTDDSTFRFAADALNRWPQASCSDQLERIFRGHDVLATIRDDDDLTALRPALVDGHRVHQSLTFRAEQYTSHPAVIRMVDGIGADAHIPMEALDVLFHCDGQSALAELIRSTDAGDDESRLRDATLASVRKLLSLGLMTTTPPAGFERGHTRSRNPTTTTI